jgi:BRO1-like domain
MRQRSSHRTFQSRSRILRLNELQFFSILRRCILSLLLRKTAQIVTESSVPVLTIRSAENLPYCCSRIHELEQNAAGTLSFLISSAIPKTWFSPDDQEVPWDLTESFVRSLEWLMLAQAQECAWQIAVIGQCSGENGLIARSLATESYKSGLIAKLAANVGSIPSMFPPRLSRK